MKSSSMTPSKLRITLIVVMCLIVAAGAGIFMYGYSLITQQAKAAEEVNAKAAESNTSVQRLTNTKRLLEQQSSTVERAAQLVAQSKSYAYQDKIIDDIKRYADEAGIAITSITFADTRTTAVAGAATQPSSGGTPATATPSAPPPGVKSATATVALRNPVSYTSMLTFLHSIEQSLFRMQISQVSLSSASDKDSGKVSSDTLTIEVFLR